MDLQQRLTDFSYLRRIAPPDTNLVEEMVDLFIENIPEYINSIKYSYANNDRESLRQAAHKMKSSVSYMGIDSLFNLLQELECQAHQVESLASLKPYVDRVCDLSMEAMEELHQVKDDNR